MFGVRPVTHRDASSLLSPLSATVLLEAATVTARRQTDRRAARLARGARPERVAPPELAQLFGRRAATGALLPLRAPADTSGAARSGASDMVEDMGAALERATDSTPC